MFHCHVLAHEDYGMMGPSPGSSPPPGRATPNSPSATSRVGGAALVLCYAAFLVSLL